MRTGPSPSLYSSLATGSRPKWRDVRRKDETMKRAATLMMLTISTGALAQTNALTMEQRMMRVMIPAIEFRQADAVEVLTYLIEAGTARAPTNIPSIGRIQTNAPRAPLKTYVLDVEDGTALAFPALTLNYRRISLFDAISKVMEKLGLTFRFENDQRVLFTKDGKSIVRRDSAEPAGDSSAHP